MNNQEIKNRIQFLEKEAASLKNELDKKLLRLENICKEILHLQEKIKIEES